VKTDYSKFAALSYQVVQNFIMTKKIQSALISVFYKDGLEPIVRQLNELGVRLISTGGTKSFIEGLGLTCTGAE
jgi:phosphoribosylaminoimidazolecarboxamide formyltransferase/IMP cyclohydrolase